MNSKLLITTALGLMAFGTQAGHALAGEGASSNITLGATTFQTPVIPGPGFYYSNYVNYYHATRLTDGDGNSLVPDFSVDAWVDYNQFVYVPPVEFGDLTFGIGAIVPFASVRQDAGGTISESKGLADIVLQPLIIGWKKDNFHAVLVQGVIAPTGTYDASSDVNVGRNTWQYQPQLSLGYVDPDGLELTATMTYITSGTNKDPMNFFANVTNSPYKTGDELGVDFALGYNFTPKFEMGLTGYYYQQLSADKIKDPVGDAVLQQNFNGFKGRVAALGIGARYLSEYGEFYAQVNREFAAENRTEGTSAWLRWSVAF
ncbi:MAG: transporter [Rhizobium sp.]|nr:transporter [Rhizobium sp.]